ncbi:Uncharacterized protein HZ326_15956 [Fusarium oxysporum f. sp. albedinis]|nr:Uncharacterized protein HZ326_15956 [Fusarium oxysporum f. sp. albedinis]
MGLVRHFAKASSGQKHGLCGVAPFHFRLSDIYPMNNFILRQITRHGIIVLFLSKANGFLINERPLFQRRLEEPSFMSNFLVIKDPCL